MNEFPAITVCTENLFEKIIFGKHYDIDRVHFLNVLYNKLKNNHPTNKEEDNYIRYFRRIGHDEFTLLAMDILQKYFHQDRRIFMILFDYLYFYFDYIYG